MCCPGSKFSRIHRTCESHCTRRTPAMSVAGTALVTGRTPGAVGGRRLGLELGLELGDLMPQLPVLLFHGLDDVPDQPLDQPAARGPAQADRGGGAGEMGADELAGLRSLQPAVDP